MVIDNMSVLRKFISVLFVSLVVFMIFRNYWIVALAAAFSLMIYLVEFYLWENQGLRFKLAQIFFAIGVIDFAVLILNISRIWPFLKQFDGIMLLAFMICWMVSFGLIRKEIALSKN